ncbi:OLC1v1005915C1 [Oldenlandia corymbosa var. corymbosa]|uniref:OLC1v1005915C1 n=1 Tax=Oldenlandia corymbosa var. corymbosa TaxID=529605 RepID=A0AAV1DFN3_OLDCO|nr:OLC1v1005915C1 [Oldenlandia corymbosa var. corymbosa]
MANEAPEIPESELCSQLIEAGQKLLGPPPSVDEVLQILNSVEELLSSVGQEPSRALREALVPAMNGLISEKLFRHDSVDVKVSVLFCIHELIRVGAPDSPYVDDRMKEIFQETVNNVFGKLSLFSGRSYAKALQILHTVAKVKSSLILLDIGCNALISRMFQVLMDTIQPNHPDVVFSNMEEIMTTLIQESDEVSVDLLKPLLTVVDKENQINSPPSQILAMKVLKNCSEIVKPYLIEFVEQLRKDVAACTYIIASIWPDMPASENVAKEAEKEASSVPLMLEVGTTQRDDYESSSANDKISKALICHENNEKMPTEDTESVQTGTGREAGLRTNKDASIILAAHEQVEQLQIVDADKTQPETLLARNNTGKTLMVDEQVEQIRSVAKKCVEPETLETGEVLRGGRGKSSTTYAGNEQIEQMKSPPKECEMPDALVTTGRGKKAGPEQIKPLQLDTSESGKGLKHSVVRADRTSSENPRRQSNYGKRKSLPEKKGQPKKKKILKEECEAEVLPKGCQKPQDGKEYREELIGERILVWWPEDKQFYEGFVETYDPIKKEHKVAYLDEDVEVLRLENERWLLRECDETSSHYKKFRTVKGYNKEIVGSRVKVLWAVDHEYYDAAVESYDPIKEQHKVAYIDGDVEFVKLDVHNCILVGHILTQARDKANLPNYAAARLSLQLKQEGVV